MTEMPCSRRGHPWADDRSLIVERVGAPNGLIGVAELARRLGVARSTVYAHSATLGAIRLGVGPPGAAAVRLRRGPGRPANGRTAPRPAAVAGAPADAHPGRQSVARGPGRGSPPLGPMWARGEQQRERSGLLIAGGAGTASVKPLFFGP